MHRLVFLHFEKGIAAAFAAWLAIGGSGVVVPPPGLGEDARLRADLAGVEAFMGSAEAKMPPLADRTAALAGELSPAVRPAGDLPGWLCHRRPLLVVATPPEPEPVDAVHAAPTDFQVIEVRHGAVVLSWKHALKNEHVSLKGYVVRRAREGDAFEKLKELAAGETRFVDTAVEARTTYRYELVDRVELDRGDLDAKTKLRAPAELALSVLAPAPAETPADILVAVDSGTKADPVQGTRGEAALRVWRWDAAAGRFGAPKSFLRVYEGEKLGSTGAVVEKIDEVVVPGKARKQAQVMLRWPDGKVDALLEGVVPKR